MRKLEECACAIVMKQVCLIAALLLKGRRMSDIDPSILKNIDHGSAEHGFDLQFDSGSKIMHIKFTGNMELKGLIASFSAVIRHPLFYFNMPACYDFSNAVMDIDINSTEVIFHFVAGLRGKRGDDYQIAFIYSDEMTKVLVDFYRLFFSRTSIDVEVFDLKSKAIEWIKESREPVTVSYI